MAENTGTVTVKVSLEIPPTRKSFTDTSGKRHKLGDLPESAVEAVVTAWAKAMRLEAKTQREEKAAEPAGDGEGSEGDGDSKD